MERDIPHRDTPETFLFIHFNSKYFKFIPNNSISFQIIIFHSKNYFFVHVFFRFEGLFQDLLFFFPICFFLMFVCFFVFFKCFFFWILLIYLFCYYYFFWCFFGNFRIFIVIVFCFSFFFFWTFWNFFELLFRSHRCTPWSDEVRQIDRRQVS